MTETTDLRDLDTHPLTGEEFLCLVLRETGTRSYSGPHGPADCRFCSGILYSRRQLRDAGMVLDDSGQPIREDE